MILNSKDLEGISFQVEVPTQEVTRKFDLMDKLNDLSFKIENTPGRPVTCWHFESLKLALQAVTQIFEAKEEGKEVITHRLICQQLNALYIQYGEFDDYPPERLSFDPGDYPEGFDPEIYGLEN